MLVSLSDISATLDKVGMYTIPIEKKKFNYMGSTYNIIGAKPIELIITNVGRKKILIEANTSIILELFCGRCLEKIEYPMEISISKEIDLNQTNEERIKDLDETSYIVGFDLDVDILVYNEILLGFPMQILCKNECRGMCRSCGENLNSSSCDCDNTEYDPRMLAIRDIFKEFKEV